jgi:hypothetical protein
MQGLELLSAMITPAVLISACGTLLFSTAARLGRVVDRARVLLALMERIAAGETKEFPEEHRPHAERQLATNAVRGRLIQAAVTSFYVALALFVTTMLSIGLLLLAPRLLWLPSALGVAGVVVLLYGSVQLVRETRLAIHSVDDEMAFILRLRDLYQERGQAKR